MSDEMDAVKEPRSWQNYMYIRVAGWHVIFFHIHAVVASVDTPSSRHKHHAPARTDFFHMPDRLLGTAVQYTAS